MNSRRLNSFGLSSIARPSRCGAPPSQVEAQVVDLDLLRVARLDAAPAEGADAGEELLEGERLREVVVGAGVESAHAVVDAVERGKQQDGGVDAAAAEGLAHLHAVDLGQHHVEDDDVVRAFEGHLQALLAVVGEVGGVAFFLEHAADELRQAALILDDKYVHFWVSSARLGGSH